ncbi:MAG: dienelactone hydrolase family protein [Acidimicrobiia bacterium]
MSVLAHEGGEFPVLYRTYNVPSGSGYRRGFVSRPDATGQFPAVVILAPTEGITSQAKSIAWQLARRGFSLVAIDPSDGDYSEATDRQMLGAVADAIEFVLSEETVAPGRVGLWGLGPGGRLALIAAAERSDIAAVVVAEAPLRGDPDRDYEISMVLPRLQIPVLGLYGREDPNISTDDVDAAQAAVAHSQWIIYEDVGAAFLDPDDDGYHPGAEYDSVVRATQLFGVALPPAVLAA